MSTPQNTAMKRDMIHSKRRFCDYLSAVCFGIQLIAVASGNIHSSISRRQSSLCFVKSLSTRVRQHGNHKAAVTIKSNENDSLASPEIKPGSISNQIPELYSVDVRYNSRSPLTYDEATGRYLNIISTDDSTNKSDDNNNNQRINVISRFLQSAFVPEGVTPSYYKFMRWRILQRFVNANVHVIGTQSLLMGLRGMHRGKAAGVGAVATGAAAATNWVLKDTLGKIVRMGE